jgi:glycosyltransferase involved in cell wall biosynthesis
LRNLIWKVQKLVGVPYLNVFSNLSFYDAYLHCLPGHDIVHERNGIFKGGIAQACKRLGIPYVYFFDGDDVFEHNYAGEPLKGILLWRAKEMLKNNFEAADAVICVSEAMKKRLVSVWQVQEHKIEVFPNAVDTTVFQPYPEDSLDVRASLGVGENPMLIFVGSFYPWQDVKLLLDTFSDFLTIRRDAHLVLVGVGEQYDEMRKYANKLGINQNTHFTGFLPHNQLAHFISSADVAIAPYCKMASELFLGSPMKLFEYMSCGTASIASGMGQINEIIQDGVNGMLVEPGNKQALSDAVMKLIGDPGLRKRLGLQARKDAVEKYSWDHYIDRLENLYFRVTQQVT